MNFAVIDKSQYPIIITRFNPIEPTEKMHLDYLVEYEAIIRNSPSEIVLVLDIRQSKAQSADFRIRQGNWAKKHDELFKKKVLGLAFVNQSIINTFILKGIFLIKKPSVPYCVVNDLKEAMSWANKQLESVSV